MIKQLSFVFAFLLLSTALMAQEKLMPIQSNNAYPVQSLEKGARFDFDFVCNPEQRVSLAVEVKTRPDCGAEDGNGEVIVEVINGPNGNYTFSYLSQQRSNGFDSGVEEVTNGEPKVTFSDLRAGPYIFTVSSPELVNVLTLQYGLDNIDTQPIPVIEGNFVKRDVFCDQKGLIGFSFDITDRELPIFRWSKDTLEGILSSENLRQRLPPSTYYFRDTTSKSECHAYQLFEIGREATIDTLPFVEDFSTSLLYPDLAAWQDDYAFVNQTMAFEPLSIGVATLDGFNQFGQPYEPISNEDQVGLIDGAADRLTTNPVCYRRMDEFGTIQELIPEGQKEVYLRFYYQPQGLGDFPNSKDSLELSFYGNDGEWHQVWRLQGPTTNQSCHPFNPIKLRIQDIDETTAAVEITEQISVLKNDTLNCKHLEEGIEIYDTVVDIDTVTIENVNFIFSGFQFRFTNNATVSGFNDHWNIDYIEFDVENILESEISDLTPIAPIPSLIKDYQAIPWRHFVNNAEEVLKDSIFIPLRNNDPNDVAGNKGSLRIGDVCTETNLYTEEIQLAVPIGTIVEEPLSGNGFSVPEFLNVKDSIVSNLPANALGRDSAVFEITYQIIDDVDANQKNNTVFEYQKFFNYYAYDDGTAEVAYGLEGAESQLAMKYDILEDDILRAIQINFVNMNSNDEDNAIYLMVWDSICVGTNRSSLLYSEEIRLTPQYVSERNGFYTFLLEEPLPVSKGTIYIGFEQEFRNQINLGFDRNNIIEFPFTYCRSDTTIADVASHTFFNSSSIWVPSIIPGTVMMRPVFGKALNESDVNVGIEGEKTPIQDLVTLYPNPANDRISFDIGGDYSLQWVRIFDFSGRMVEEKHLQNHSMDIRTLPNGLYLVKTYDSDLQEMSTHKLVKQ